jgi:NADPH:quinone reductase-like Zn-dependent oxidoreductase
VRVAATSFNPVEVAIRAGSMREVFSLDLPHTPGIDLAGTVAELGPGVEGLQVGEAVVAFLPVNAPGAAGEYVLAPADLLAAAPKTVELAAAAALPAVGLTAWQAMFELAGLQAGQTILINGAAGAVGGYAVQLAVQAGARVTATARERSADRLRGYGVDRIIGYLDYATSTLTAEGAPFDVVLNLVTTTPEETAALAALIRDGGILVSATTPAPANLDRGIRTAQVFAVSKADQLTEIVSRVDAGQLRIDVAEFRPLTELRAVHDDAAAGRLRGKTVVVPG